MEMIVKDIEIATQMASVKVNMAVINLSVSGLNPILLKKIGNAI